MSYQYPHQSPHAYQPHPFAVPRSRVNGLGVTSFILGLWSILTCIIPLGIGLFLAGLPSILGLIFGIIGIVAGKRDHKGTGLAITGTVLSSFTIILFFLGAGTVW